ncbi:MAG: hypothetical protein JWO06_953 [Bacteroidota bacterium]|nr:hypothetical protein [Bacteroidota bacterium]
MAKSEKSSLEKASPLFRTIIKASLKKDQERSKEIGHYLLLIVFSDGLRPTTNAKYIGVYKAFSPISKERAEATFNNKIAQGTQSFISCKSFPITLQEYNAFEAKDAFPL